jgi:hypothetical protein
MGIMDAAKDDRRSPWNQWDSPKTLDDWRDCAKQEFVDDGLLALGLGSVVEAGKIVEEVRQNAARNLYMPKTLGDKSEPTKE